MYRRFGRVPDHDRIPASQAPHGGNARSPDFQGLPGVHRLHMGGPIAGGTKHRVGQSVPFCELLPGSQQRHAFLGSAVLSQG